MSFRDTKADWTNDAYMLAKNPHQGREYRKVLFVCSGSILRSPTAAHWASANKGWNTRCAGTHPAALIPVTDVLIEWADQIYVMEEEHIQFMEHDWAPLDKSKIKVLGIPDTYGYRNPKLVEIIAEKLKNE